MLRRNNGPPRHRTPCRNRWCGAQRNLPANCQAQDISNYRFALLRATPRVTAVGLEDEPRVHARAEYGCGVTTQRCGKRRLNEASLVGWLSDNGRCRIGLVDCSKIKSAPSAVSGGNRWPTVWKCAGYRCAL